ncbi:hypothetical protein QOZ80_2AG0102610 [Eleusine coracana subsp. coracana]|nr:hypothetical protein QOZ80_2AG0102610 [Eleusine coracana subsp. coracana]
MAARSASIASFVLLLLLVAVPSSSNHVKLDLHGNIYPDGEFYTTVKIGEQAKEYNLHVDTGSVLTWVQCSVPPGYCKGPCKKWQQPYDYYELIPAKVVRSTDPLCRMWLKHTGDPNKGCSYKLGYSGGESSLGYLVHDMFPLRSNDHHVFAFGCGYNQEGVHEPSQVGGVLALGRDGSPVALTSQLKQQSVITKNVISHCFRARGGGFLFIGEVTHSSAGISWVALDRNTGNGHYSPAVQAALHFQGKPISNNLMKVVFDSGTTYTLFDREPYQMTVNAVKASLHRSLREVEDPAMELCWRGAGMFGSVYEVKPLFKTLALVFKKANKIISTLEIPPENYLIISGNGNVCFAIHPNPVVGGMNVIGAVTMQDRIIIYDNEAKQIGWVHGPCGTESEPEITSRL